MVPDRARRPTKIAGPQLDEQKTHLGHLEFASNAETGRGNEAESRVAARVSQDNDGTEPELFALGEPGTHERSANTLPPMC